MNGSGTLPPADFLPSFPDGEPRRRWRLLPRRLAPRVALVSALGLLLVIVGLAVYRIETVTRYTRALIVEQGRALARGIAGAIIKEVEAGNTEKAEAQIAALAKVPGVLGVYLHDTGGQPLCAVSNAPVSPPARVALPPAPPSTLLRLIEPVRWQAAGSALPEDLPHGEAWAPVGAGSDPSAWLRVDFSLAELDRIRSEIVFDYGVTAAAAFLLLVGLMTLAMRGPVAQLRRAVEFSGRLYRHQGEQLQVNPGPQDLQDLVAALNLASRTLHEQDRAATQARLQMAETSQRLRLALDAAGLATWEFRAQDAAVHLDPRWSQIVGGPAAPRRASLREIVRGAHPADRKALVRTLRALAHEPQADYRVEHRVRHEDGTWRWVLCRGRVVERDSQGRATRVIGTNADITELKRAERQLIEAKEAAEAASRAKSQFLANMSHEIRTPLNAVIGAAELVLDSPLSAEQRQFLKIVRSSGNSLLTILNDVLDVSKIEAGQVTLEEIPFSLREVLFGAARSLALRAAEKGLDFTVSVDPGVPERLVGDPNRLRQVLLNLVGNAVKFTDRGEIELFAGAMPENGGGVRVAFEVRDTGIGIPQERQREIFAPFTQADNSVTRRFGGTGLGLAICTHLVELMGGRITVESAPGAGSTFRFSARFAPAQEAAQAPRVRAPFAGGAVLAVVESPRALAAIAGKIAEIGMVPLTATTREQALAAVESARRGDSPLRAAFVDLKFAGSGDTLFATELAAACGAQVPVIGVSDPLTQAAVVPRRAEMGLAASLSRPVSRTDLCRVLTAAWGGGTAGPPPAGAAPSGPGLEVLLAEDNAVNQTLMLRLLRNLGHRADAVCNGAEALSALAVRRYDLVLMDLQMPVMDGIAATQAIRRDERERGLPAVPIVALTADALTDSAERCHAAGMDGFLTKPVRPTELAAAIEAARLDRSGGAAASDGPESAPAFDRRHALGLLGGDEALLRELVGVFLKDADSYPANLAAAREAGDCRRLMIAAHTLKGAASNLGGAPLKEACLRLETAARDSGFGAAVPLVAPMEQEFTRFVGALQAFLDTEKAASS